MNINEKRTLFSLAVTPFILSLAMFAPSQSSADGFIVPPAHYEGSLEEKSQEAIIIFRSPAKPDKADGATEDLILKITVEGAVEKFAWVIPFPNKPTVKKADAKLFKELYDYVAYRQRSHKSKGMKKALGGMGGDVARARDDAGLAVDRVAHPL